MARYTILIFIVLLLGGCTSIFGLDSAFRDRSNDYLRAVELPPMVVPAGLDGQVIGQIYPVPQAGQVASYQLEDEFRTPRPAKIDANRASGEVRIQRLGDDQWILVGAPPGEIWPRVRAFLAASGIGVASANADQGVIDSDWLSFDGDDESYHRFRVRLEQGVQLFTAEISILHQSVSPEALDGAIWEQAQGNSAQAQWLRENLAQSLASDQGRAASLLGQQIGAAAKVEMVTPSAADPYLQMNLSLARAWASVEYAMGSDQFELVEREREAGLLRFSHQPEVEQRSWFRRLFSRSSGNRSREYLLRLEPRGDYLELRIMAPDGSSLDQRQAFEMLSLIRSNLT